LGLEVPALMNSSSRASKEWGWTSPALVGEDGGLIAGHVKTPLRAQSFLPT